MVPRRKRKIKQTRNIKSRNTAGSNCNDYKPTCLASQSLRVIHPDKLSNVLSERCCERYECENVQTTTQFPFVSTTTGPVDECVKYFDKHGCGEKVQCVGSTVLTQIPRNKTHPSIRRRCCDIWQCNQVDECEQYFEKHSCGSKPTCHGEEILVSKPINKKAQIFSTVVVPYGVARNPISTRTNVSIILKTTSAEKNLSARKAK